MKDPPELSGWSQQRPPERPTSPLWARQHRITASEQLTQNFQGALFSSLLEATTGCVSLCKSGVQLLIRKSVQFLKDWIEGFDDLETILSDCPWATSLTWLSRLTRLAIV